MLTQQYCSLLYSRGFLLLFTCYKLSNRSVRRMVTSISSDRAVWNAVLKNNEVQKFQQSLKQGRVCRLQGSNEKEPDLVSILKWFFENMKLKVVELIAVLKSLVSNNLGTPSPWKENSSNPGVNFKHQLEEMICSTVLLSIITLMVVLVNRAYGC